jgi:hypothetical protein
LGCDDRDRCAAVTYAADECVPVTPDAAGDGRWYIGRIETFG